MQADRAETPNESVRHQRELQSHVYHEIEQSFRALLHEAQKHHGQKQHGSMNLLDFGSPEALYKKGHTDHSKSTAHHTESNADHTKSTADHTKSTADRTKSTADHTKSTADHTKSTADRTKSNADLSKDAADHTKAKNEVGTPASDNLTVRPSNDVIKPADANRPTDATKPTDATPAPGSPEATLKAQRDQLDQKARETMNGADLDQFRQNMKAFETRMQKMEEQYRLGGDSPEAAHKRALAEATKTYEQTARLLADKADAPTGVTSAQRIEIAKSLINNAATPTSIDQGYHNTCNVNTVEVRAFTRNPSDASKAIVDSVMTGSFTTKDGHNIIIDKGSLQPDKEASQIPTPDGARNYASQIFQVAAVNAFYQPNTNGNVRYCVQKPDGTAKPPADGGDFLMDYSKNPPEKLGNPNNTRWDRLKMWWHNETDHYSEQPQLGWLQIKTAGERITGDKSDWYLAQWNGGKTEEEFTQRIAEAKAKGNLPLVVQVHTNNEPFYTDSNHGAAGGSGGSHVVTIQDYIPGPPAKVKIDNSWGSDADHNTDAKAVPLHDLFIAMRHDPKESIALQQKDVDDNKASGKIDDYKAVDLLRMQHDNGIVTGADYQKALIERMQDIKKHVADGTLNSADYYKTMIKLNGMISVAPNGQSLELRSEEHRLGLIDNSAYSQWITYEFNKLGSERQKAIKAGTYDLTAQHNWFASIKILLKTLNELPAAERQSVIDQLKKSHAFDESAAA